MAKDVFAHIEDKELLNKFYSDGNNQWLGLLLERYTMLLLGVCMKYLKDEEEAKDAVQQIFLKVITELPKYRVDYFKSWLYMIAKNLCLMKIRDRHGKVPVELTDKFSVEEVHNKAELYEKDQTLSMVEEGLKELNAEQKLCVTLFYLQKKSYQQITGATGYTLLQVKSFIQNGKRNLKLIVEKKLKKQMADWKEILSDNEEQLSDEDLLKYLDENTPEEEKYVIEKKLQNTSFESDAIDGLQQIDQPDLLPKHVKQLNKKLYQQLAIRKQRKTKEKVMNYRWILLAILLLLFICIMGYLVIHLNNKSAAPRSPGGQTTEQAK